MHSEHSLNLRSTTQQIDAVAHRSADAFSRTYVFIWTACEVHPFQLLREPETEACFCFVMECLVLSCLVFDSKVGFSSDAAALQTPRIPGGRAPRVR